jgi:hypothetical protein
MQHENPTKPYRSPEIIDVGDVTKTTFGNNTQAYKDYLGDDKTYYTGKSTATVSQEDEDESSDE